MQLALQLAEQGRYTVAPNPMVGCVIVRDMQIVGTGYHVRAGEAHAEIHALRAAGDLAKGATAYVSLEPCCHHGLTPPCTDALIQAQIRKVYVACLDPNPLVAGKGIALLRAAGIEVEIGLEAHAATQLNEIFFHYIQKQRPFVILKWAMSIDGKTETHVNDSRQISNPETQIHAHALRRSVQAIIVGAQTVIRDNPFLTVRENNQHLEVQPLRVILCGKSKIPLDSNIFCPTLPGNTLLVLSDASQLDWYKHCNTETLVLPHPEHLVNLPALMQALASRHVVSVLVEGGMSVQHSFMHAGLINKIHVYVADVVIGALDKKKTLSQFNVQTLGNNLHLVGYL